MKRACRPLFFAFPKWLQNIKEICFSSSSFRAGCVFFGFAQGLASVTAEPISE